MPGVNPQKQVAHGGITNNTSQIDILPFILAGYCCQWTVDHLFPPAQLLPVFGTFHGMFDPGNNISATSEYYRQRR